MKAVVLAVAAAATVAAATIWRRYRGDMNAAAARLADLDRRMVSTDWGPVEFAEQGDGEPVLVLHGIFGGCDNGLLGARDLCSGRGVVAVSRFGYLGSGLPPDATPADQADALAALLEALNLGAVDVIGVSAGATSAFELAIRHPDRVKHLVVLVGNVPGSPTAVVPPAAARLVDRQLPIWMLNTFAPRLMRRLAGVPATFPMTDADTRSVTEMLETMFPLTPRRPGVLFDAFVSNPAVNSCDLEAIRSPTLIAHTKDDILASHDASRDAAARIPGARFLSLETGGHFLLGQAKTIHDELVEFLSTRSADSDQRLQDQPPGELVPDTAP